MSKPKPTPQQEAFVEAVLSSSDNLLLEAVAGSGKTSTGVLAVNAVPPSTKVVNATFAKRNQLDLAEKMPSWTINKTWNALGHAAWQQVTAKKRLMLDDKKIWKILSQFPRPKGKAPYRYDDFPGLKSLVEKAQAIGLVPKIAPQPSVILVPDTDEIWEQLIDFYDIDIGALEDSAIDVARFVLDTSIRMAYEGVITFSDQLYMSAMFGGPFPRADILFADEAQDLSPIQHQMIRRMRPGRILAAGDRRQAIYAFRGADAQSLENMSQEFKLKLMPLTVSFRCSKAVVAEASQVVPWIEPWEGAAPGSVQRLKAWSSRLIKAGDTILCRNTKPLIPVFYSLIGSGKRAKVLGMDIGRGLILIVKKLDGPLVSDLLEQIEHWRDTLVMRALEKGRSIQPIEEKAAIIRLICNRVGRSAHKDAVIAELENMFSDSVAPITLSTIHKAKGLEWPRVFFLDPGLIPSPYAKRDWELEQESNLRYVGITRAKQDLFYIETDTHEPDDTD